MTAAERIAREAFRLYPLDLAKRAAYLRKMADTSPDGATRDTLLRRIQLLRNGVRS